MVYLHRALATDPDNAVAHAQIGHLYAHNQQWPLAEVHFRAWIKNQPWLGGGYTSLAEAQEHLGDYAGARQTLQQALDPKAICDEDALRAHIARLELKAKSIVPRKVL